VYGVSETEVYTLDNKNFKTAFQNVADAYTKAQEVLKELRNDMENLAAVYATEVITGNKENGDLAGFSK
jgi:hypothetical protein